MADIAVNEPRAREEEILKRLDRVAFDPGQDDPKKQEKANDVMAATIAVKEATQHFIDNSPEARKARALAARKSDESLLGESQSTRDYKKPVSTPTVGTGHNIVNK